VEHNTGMGLWCITGERVFAGALPTAQWSWSWHISVEAGMSHG